MYQKLYPNWQAHPGEVFRGFYEKLVEAYWHYGQRIVVAYEHEANGRETVTGVAVWERCGPGWEELWGVGGWFDPREYTYNPPSRHLSVLPKHLIDLSEDYPQVF